MKKLQETFGIGVLFLLLSTQNHSQPHSCPTSKDDKYYIATSVCHINTKAVKQLIMLLILKEKTFSG